MSSLPEAIVSAMVAALAPTVGIGQRVFRSREEAITLGETPCIVVLPAIEETTAFSAAVDDNVLTVSVEVFVRGDPYDQLADPALVSLHGLLMRDPVLAGLVTRVRKKSKSWEAQEADQTAGSVVTKYEMRYLSATDDLTALI